MFLAQTLSGENVPHVMHGAVLGQTGTPVQVSRLGGQVAKKVYDVRNRMRRGMSGNM